MNSTTNSLRTALKFNAAFSLSTGLILLIIPETMAAHLGVKMSIVLIVIGIGLLLFVAVLLATAFAKTLSLPSVRAIIILDALWVIGSLGLLIFQPFQLLARGYLIIGMVAAIVAGLGYWQYSVWKKL